MEVPFTNAFATHMVQDVGVTCADIEQWIPSGFLARLIVADTVRSCIKPGTWYCEIGYLQGDDEVEIAITAYGYNGVHLESGYNIPARLIGLGTVYWTLQKHMQNRMDAALYS